MNTIDARKKLNDLLRRASSEAKKQKCILCDQPQTSFCKSHLIPDFVLRNIAQDGYLVTASGVIDINDIVQPDMQIIDYIKGHKDACTFQIICRSCDSRVFADYETEKGLLSGLNNRIFAEIALKNHLMVLSKRNIEIELYKLINQELSVIEGKEILDNIHSHDIYDEQFQLRRCKKIIDKNLQSGYQVIFSDTLDWVVPIAVQTPIAFHRDLEGNVVNEIYSDAANVIIRDAHLIVFPLSFKTVIALFFHRDDRNYIKFQRQFSRRPYHEQLELINYYIFKYSENYVISPLIDASALSNASLKRLSAEVDENGGLGITGTKYLGKNYEPVNPSSIPNFLLMKL